MPCVVEQNYCHDHLVGITVMQDNVIVRNNLCTNNIYYGICLLVWSGDLAGVSVLHNTVINHAYRGIILYDSAAAGCAIENNIIRAMGSQVLIYVPSAAFLTDNTVDYNIGYTSGNWGQVGGTGYSLANWDGLDGTPDTHSANDNPDFVAETVAVETTVDADSNSGQPVLNVASTSGYSVGDVVNINVGGVRAEIRRILSISAGVSLTMTSNLSSTHTAVQADTVRLYTYDAHLQTTSPAKNTGATGLGVPQDYDGVTRDAQPDIGAYEFV